ncbi:DNRLRE domain-containing protein [Clostridium sp.]|uniref:DNRLRE domain-containing protein n=1 Tax=Clostridium sp. TaxID=1506 RepID=UPI003D6C7DE6
MASILIPATRSLTVTNRLPNGNINDNTIFVGNDGGYNYISYLFFDISAIPTNVSISSAELVLFKTNKFYNDSKQEFFIHPLSDYFSTYTSFNNQPRVNRSLKKKFNPIISDVAVSVNLAYFVSLWLSNKLNNTGIALFSENHSVLAEFGSSMSVDSYLTPFIKVVISNECNDYKKTHCNPVGATMRQVRVIGTVAEDSQYEAIINIGVKRNDSGHTDNYYVADEYNNLLSGSPLYIDKTYNMAVIPKEKPGDVETTEFFGSYKA